VDSGDKGVKSAWPCRINWTVASLPLSQIGPIFSRRSPVEPQPRRFAATVRLAQAAYPLSGVNRTFSRSVYWRCFFGRGRNGDAFAIFQKSPWVVGVYRPADCNGRQAARPRAQARAGNAGRRQKPFNERRLGRDLARAWVPDVGQSRRADMKSTAPGKTRNYRSKTLARDRPQDQIKRPDGHSPGPSQVLCHNENSKP
jgi:hypothetical protein